jgi:peptidyl-prolyl cis-trans isomerase-like 4
VKLCTRAGDSLCYAFIGFDTDKASEDAYFKMNNVLIDDRRIKARWDEVSDLSIGF